MSLKNLVSSKSSGTFGTFEVSDGNVTKNRKSILNFFNGTTALVPMDARSAFTTPEEHAAFDAVLWDLSANSFHIQYVDSIAKFMDPKARFKDWLDGKLTPASVGLTLTAEELAVPTAYESAKAKFIALFTPPKPVLSEGGIDLLAAGFTSDQAVRIDQWRVDGTGLTRDISAYISGDQKTRNVLRIVKGSGSAYRIENPAGHSTTRTQFLRAYNDTIKPLWDRTPPNGEIGRLGRVYMEAKENGSYMRDKEVQVFNNYVTIGCQAIPRAEVERVVAQFANLGITR